MNEELQGKTLVSCRRRKKNKEMRREKQLENSTSQSKAENGSIKVCLVHDKNKEQKLEKMGRSFFSSWGLDSEKRGKKVFFSRRVGGK